MGKVCGSGKDGEVVILGGCGQLGVSVWRDCERRSDGLWVAAGGSRAASRIRCYMVGDQHVNSLMYLVVSHL
jgi:hypothetical protein